MQSSKIHVQCCRDCWFIYDSRYLVLQAVTCDQALSQTLQEVLLFHYTMSSAVMKPMIVFSGT